MFQFLTEELAELRRRHEKDLVKITRLECFIRFHHPRTDLERIKNGDEMPMLILRIPEDSNTVGSHTITAVETVNPGQVHSAQLQPQFYDLGQERAGAAHPVIRRY